MILLCPWLRQGWRRRDARDHRPSARWLWCRLETSHAPVLSPPPGARTSLSDRTVATLASGGQHPNNIIMLYNACCMLHVVCDLVLCPPAMFRTRIVSVMLLQLGAEFWNVRPLQPWGLYHLKKIILSLDTDLQLCGRNEPNFILLWRLKCWEHAFWGIKHIHNSYDRNVTSV